MTNPLSLDKNCTVILKDLPEALAKELCRQAEERGMSADELASELISRQVEADGDV